MPLPFALPFSLTAHADFVSGFWSLLSLCRFLCECAAPSICRHSVTRANCAALCRVPAAGSCWHVAQHCSCPTPRTLPVATHASPSPSWFNVLTQSHSFSICQHDDILLFAQCLVASPSWQRMWVCLPPPLPLPLPRLCRITHFTYRHPLYLLLPPPPSMPTEAGNHCKCEWLCTRNFAVNLTVHVQRFLHWTDSRNDL